MESKLMKKLISQSKTEISLGRLSILLKDFNKQFAWINKFLFFPFFARLHQTGSFLIT